MMKINIIGAGLAGSECALYLANKGYKINLYDIKSKDKTPAHHSNNFAEIVCSNSFKSDDENTASGVFKRELMLLGSELIKTAYSVRVPAGQALAIDRDEFSKIITEKIKSNKNINIICEDVNNFDNDAITVVATGPLSTPNMCNALKQLLGQEFLYFYDAAAPIISADSIDLTKAFFASRYNKGNGNDYLNCPMTKPEYLKFYQELITAKTVQLHEFEKNNIFESCMPIEILAKRGEDAMRYGPVKPVGIFNPNGLKPYAVVQLRKENNNATMYNMVGFQTNLTFGEQKRVFSLIPGLENANFLRYGVMHTNNYVNFPKCLDIYSRVKSNHNIFIAGQLSGVEGYVESIASGLYVAINIDRMMKNQEFITFSADTILGGLYNYLINANATNFQPINANFGILNPIEEKDKQKRYIEFRKRALCEIEKKVKIIKEI